MGDAGRARTATVERPEPPAVCLAGAERLRLLEKLLPFAQSLRVYGTEPLPGSDRAPEASAWELVLEDARVTFTLSPELHRGFSGEGGVLRDLASAPDSVIDEVAATLHGDAAIHPVGVAGATGSTVAEVGIALRALGAAGRVGYDLGQAAFFHRELPFERSLARARPPAGRRAAHERR